MLKLVIGNRLEIMWQTAVLTTLSKGEGSKTKREGQQGRTVLVSHPPEIAGHLLFSFCLPVHTVSLLLRGHTPHVHSSKL